MPDSENKDQFYYSSWLRYTLSEKLLIVTTKIRTIMDILIEDQRFFQENGEEPYIEISKIEKSVSEGRKIGKYLEGNGPCTIRDCCNRIIHASTIHPNISYAKDAYDKLFSFNKNLKCWNGMLFLYGEKNGKNWKFELSVADFCIVLESFLSKIETEI
ncbi:MAG: hypothetical protein KKD38_06165, partial [Candidatus Delongbacteria bacterium]|nr:hypothetical protein [Candidatus Delongbacteria bacterium]